MYWTNFFLLALFTLLNCADLVLTLLCLKIGGSEENKLISWLMDKLGALPALIIIKGLMLCLVFTVSWILWLNWLLTLFLAVACAAYVYVVLNNIAAYKGLSGE